MGREISVKKLLSIRVSILSSQDVLVCFFLIHVTELSIEIRIENRIHDLAAIF